MLPILIAEIGEAAQLVDRHEVLHAVRKLPGHVAGVIGEGQEVSRILPAAGKRLPAIPVEQGDVGLDALGEQLVDDALVIIDTLGFGCPRPSGKMRDQAIDMR